MDNVKVLNIAHIQDVRTVPKEHDSFDRTPDKPKPGILVVKIDGTWFPVESLNIRVMKESGYDDQPNFRNDLANQELFITIKDGESHRTFLLDQNPNYEGLDPIDYVDAGSYEFQHGSFEPEQLLRHQRAHFVRIQIALSDTFPSKVLYGYSNGHQNGLGREIPVAELKDGFLASKGVFEVIATEGEHRVVGDVRIKTDTYNLRLATELAESLNNPVLEPEAPRNTLAAIQEALASAGVTGIASVSALVLIKHLLSPEVLDDSPITRQALLDGWAQVERSLNGLAAIGAILTDDPVGSDPLMTETSKFVQDLVAASSPQERKYLAENMFAFNGVQIFQGELQARLIIMEEPRERRFVELKISDQASLDRMATVLLNSRASDQAAGPFYDVIDELLRNLPGFSQAVLDKIVIALAGLPEEDTASGTPTYRNAREAHLENRSHYHSAGEIVKNLAGYSEAVQHGVVNRYLSHPYLVSEEIHRGFLNLLTQQPSLSGDRQSVPEGVQLRIAELLSPALLANNLDRIKYVDVAAKAAERIAVSGTAEDWQAVKRRSLSENAQRVFENAQTARVRDEIKAALGGVFRLG